jgi:F-type H+-transporting ATPase subunit b|tara:strand:- start:11859 stop:12434 length:576 start_codon:yes stop_codon:yes gene_type:complete
MNHYWSIPGDEVLHESTESHGASSEQNPLVQLDPGLFIWTILTFLLLLMVLAKFAWKPLLEMLDERQKSIDDSLLSAEKARLELAGINKESEAILSKSRTQAQTIVADAKSAADKLKEDIVSKAKEEADGQLKKAKNQISVEKDRALLEIRQEVVELSITVAEKIIKKNLSKDDNASIIEDSLNKLDNYEA